MHGFGNAACLAPAGACHIQEPHKLSVIKWTSLDIHPVSINSAFLFANRVQFFLYLIVWAETVSGCHPSTFILCHSSLLCTVVQSYTMEGAQKLSKQSHTGIHRACLCLCLTHARTSKLIINIVCCSKDLPSHFHQLYDIGRGESALIFQDIKQMADVLWMEKTPHVPLHIQTHHHTITFPNFSVACLSLKYYCILCFLVRNLLWLSFSKFGKLVFPSLFSWYCGSSNLLFT